MPDTTSDDFGAHLRNAREARGLTLRQIASYTKIAVSALEALERNEVSRLPGGLFTRGFVRSYADAVGLDPERTVREFARQFPDEASEPGEALREALIEINPGTSRWGLRVTILVASVLLVVISVAFGSRYFTAAPPAPGAMSAPSPRDEAAAGRARPSEVPTEQPAVAPTAGSGGVTIEIAAKGSCWVSAQADGRRVVTRLMEAGARATVEAEREIVLTIGDTGSFSYTVNGVAGRSLGASGEVARNVRITPENYLTYTSR
jgi:cytoskeletal protein RodZ